MPKEEKKPEKKPEKPKRGEFKPDIRSATAIIAAVAFLQKTGFQGTVKNIKECITMRCRKPAVHIIETLPNYLNRGLELGILRRFNGIYKLGKFDIRRRKKKHNKIHHKKLRATRSEKSPEKSAVTTPLMVKSSVGVC